MTWLPLESNPTVFQEYTERLQGPSDVLYTDVFALEDWAYDLVPQPVLALLFVFPLTRKLQERYRDIATQPDQPSLWFTKQSIPNACGTVALLHTLMNLPPGDDPEKEKGKFTFPSDGPLARMRDELADCAPAERASKMETNAELENAHQAMEVRGDTEAPTEERSHVIEHFVALIRKGNNLYEMDGRQNGPICHGRTSAATFLQDCAAVIKSIMEWDPDAVNFSLIAVCERASEKNQ